MREWLLGNMLCLVHHTQEELREKQEPSLLDIFCQGSYLHVEETTHGLQNQENLEVSASVSQLLPDDAALPLVLQGQGD